MAAAVGRGRSRALRAANSSPAPPPIPAPQTNNTQTNNSDISSPQISTPVVNSPQINGGPRLNSPQIDSSSTVNSPNPFASPAPTPCNRATFDTTTFDTTTPTVPTKTVDCMDILRISSPGYETQFINTIKLEISDNSQIPTWLASCINQLYGDRQLTENFVKMLNYMEMDKSIVFWKQILGGMLSSLQSEMNRLKPQPNSPFNEQEFCGFVELLALVGYHVKKPNGTPIYQLAPPLVECLLLLSQIGYPYEVIGTVHYVSLLYGRCLEEFLTVVSNNQPQTVSDELEKLYNCYRSIVIDDQTEDRTRLLMLEVIERRAYGFQPPQHVIEFYQRENKART